MLESAMIAAAPAAASLRNSRRPAGLLGALVMRNPSSRVIAASWTDMSQTRIWHHPGADFRKVPASEKDFMLMLLGLPDESRLCRLYARRIAGVKNLAVIVRFAGKCYRERALQPPRSCPSTSVQK